MTSLSDQIKQARYGAVSNPYQGNDKKVLFVCSMGIQRSATGSRIYGHKYNTRCAGTYGEALIQITVPLLQWADQIVFVHKDNYEDAQRFLAGDIHRHPADTRGEISSMIEKSVVLNIPDNFEHMHPEIIKAYEEQYEKVDARTDNS